ncbi:hypothetical protein ACR76C_27670 [Klebsiella grimontii]|nr:hypothetical protein [Klebsiella grimontii]
MYFFPGSRRKRLTRATATFVTLAFAIPGGDAGHLSGLPVRGR